MIFAPSLWIFFFLVASGRKQGVGEKKREKRINLQTFKCLRPTFAILLADYLQIRIIYKSLAEVGEKNASVHIDE